MTNNEQNKSKKGLLKKIGKVMIIVGIIVLVVGIFLQMFSVVSIMGKDSFDQPTNFFVVIVSGFSIMFFGIILNVVSGAMDMQKMHGSITEVIHDHVLTGLKERMRGPEEISCEYCGTVLKEDERSCPNCGANKTRKG